MATTDAPRDANDVPAALFLIDGSYREVAPGRIDNTTGRILVDSTGGRGGSSLTQETPTGTVNGSNTTFTVAHQPVFIVVDGMVRPLVTTITDINGNGFTYSAGTITVSSLCTFRS